MENRTARIIVLKIEFMRIEEAKMEEIIVFDNKTEGITNPRLLFRRIKRINIDFKQENFIVFYLDTRNNVIDSEVLFKGGVNSCLIDPKTLFRKALIHNSSGIIVAHNHPSNCIDPSDDDIIIFKELKKAGLLLQLPVLDSIIFNEEEYYSMNTHL